MPTPRCALAALLALGASAHCQEVAWDMEALSKPPQVFPVETKEEGVRAFYYENIPWKGQPTRVFAYYGVPPHAAGEKLPAMVLVHGGLGTAYAEWVRWWNKRGYAAIAMDHCGNQPTGAPAGRPYAVQRPRNPKGGPTGDGGFAQIEDAPKDQWTYQAVAAIIRANTLLRSFPEIDPNRIGLNGVSWGGYLACIVAGVDPRFRFVIPVYGCAYIGIDPSWPPAFHQLSDKQQKRWSALWDPSHFLPKARMPMLWINSTNDAAFPLAAWEKSARLPKGPQTLSLRVRMPHGQQQGAEPEEIPAFAGGILGTGEPLARVGAILVIGVRQATVRFQSASPIVSAELNYTLDDGPWKDRRWDTLPAALSPQGVAKAKIPKGTRACFFNGTDARGLTVSSECLSLK